MISSSLMALNSTADHTKLCIFSYSLSRILDPYFILPIWYLHVDVQDTLN